MLVEILVSIFQRGRRPWNPRPWRRWLAGLFLLTLLVVMAPCGGKGDKPTSTPTLMPTPTSTLTASVAIPTPSPVPALAPTIIPSGGATRATPNPTPAPGQVKLPGDEGAHGTPTPIPTPTSTPTATVAIPTPSPLPALAPTIIPGGGAPQATPTPTVAPVQVELPGDEGAHGTPIEWWYFNGHLSDQAGKTYSYHFVTFQIKTSSGFTPQLLQLSWGDPGQAAVLTEEKINFQAGPATPGRFDVQAAGWEMHGDGDSYRLMFNTAGYSLDLKATSSKPAVLHNRVGLVDLGLAGSSYYYSRTRLRVTGTLAIADGLPQEVAGIAWMDHQWGDFSTISIGWDWSSLQFDDRSELMVSMVGSPLVASTWPVTGPTSRRMAR